VGWNNNEVINTVWLLTLLAWVQIPIEVALSDVPHRHHDCDGCKDVYCNTRASQCCTLKASFGTCAVYADWPAALSTPLSNERTWNYKTIQNVSNITLPNHIFQRKKRKQVWHNFAANKTKCTPTEPTRLVVIFYIVSPFMSRLR
jgi:hypothetical protein